MPNILANNRKADHTHAARIGTLACKIALSIGLSPFIFFAAASVARADCVAEIRQVVLDKTISVPLKSYRCKTGADQNAPQIRIEFHRLSDLAASLMISNTSSTMLTKTFGAIKVVENDVSKTYGDLLKQFGTTYEVVKEQGEVSTRLSINAAAQKEEDRLSAEDTIGSVKVRHFMETTDGPDYPAADEIAALRKKTIPDGLNYYYSIDSWFCQDHSDFVCKKIGKTSFEMVFWRSMRADDVTNYSRNVRAYNSQLMQVRKDRAAAKADSFSADNFPKYFSLMKYLAGESWPEDLMIMTGQHETVACGDTGRDLPGLSGWKFSVPIRGAAMDAMVIENTSQQPVSIGALFGSRSATGALRVAADAPQALPDTDSVGALSQTLTPGQRLFVPVQVVFLAPTELSADLKKAEKSSADARTRFGLNGFSGRSDALRIPKINDYAYGPSISVRGLELNSSRINFEKAPAPNFVDLTVTSEVGSCPYLLSRSGNDHEWISHGKILHKAPSRDREYTETATFKGIRTRFRIEEREPEVAYIKDIRLAVRLQDGAELTLQPSITRAGAPAAYPLELLWGDAVDIDFILPDGVASERVADSRFSVTGYYERYASPGFEAALSRPDALEKRGEGAAFTPIDLRADRACFRPARTAYGKPLN